MSDGYTSGIDCSDNSSALYWLGMIVGVVTAVVLFIADLIPGTRQQIEEHAEQVERRVEQAEQHADHLEQQAKAK